MNTGHLDAGPGATVATNAPGSAHSDHFGYVYRCYDITGRLVYVGSTSDINQRLHIHRRQNPVADRFAVITYRSMDLGAARRLEVQLISEQRPPLNRQHNPNYEGFPSKFQRQVFDLVAAEIPVSPVGPHVVNDRSAEELASAGRRAAEAMSGLLRDLALPSAA